jgi:hypothetical protein
LSVKIKQDAMMSSRAFTAFYRENRGLVKKTEGDPIAEGMGGRPRKNLDHPDR